MKKLFATMRPIASAALRVAMIVGIMTGPVYAVAMMKAGEANKVSGAGLVLYVSLERA